ncbi:MAG: hypothetical protein RBR87_06505 [Bacteroidales bacterium]|jgi:hypothetical protein|nr:hypothetical protein [Bacteroidales bacterium]
MRTKPLFIGSFLISLLLFTNNISILGQTCATCPGNTVTGIKASAFGEGNTASGNYSFIAGRNSSATMPYASVIGSWSSATAGHAFVFGSQSHALGDNSFVFGDNSVAEFEYSMAIGHNIKARNGSFVMGTGRVDALLTNTLEKSLVIGFASQYPTFFIGKTPIGFQSGRVGIGNITAPQAKLHILADEGEHASLLLEPSNPKRYMAKLQLLDAYSGLTVGAESGLELFTNLKSMQFTAPVFNFAGNQVNMPALRINNAYSLPVTVGKPGEFLSADGTWAAPSNGGGGDSYWLPSGGNIYFGSAVGIGMEPVEKLSLDSPWGRPIHFHLGGSQAINSNAYYTGTETLRSELGPAYQISFSESNMAFKSALNGNAGSKVNWNEVMVITQQGNVGIGTADTKNYKLAVKGNLIAEEVVIKLAGQWPDFVFEDTYELMPHAELEQFIQSNKHLPGIPDAQEVVEKGVSIGEMNALLLQKIEELTLYMLQQQKEIEVLKQQLGN